MWWPLDILLVVALVIACLFACVAIMLYNSKKEALPSAIAALSDLGDGVEVQTVSHGRVFSLCGCGPRLGLVYVPGAMVDSRAYAPLCREIAKRSGCAVVLLDFPMRLAYFGPSRISQAISYVSSLGYSSISHWVVGGHSLGGAVACKFLLDQRSTIATADALQSALSQPEFVGVLLHAGYNNLRYSKRPLPADVRVLQVLAENDGLVSKEDLEKFKPGLPESNTVIVNIDGGNHAGFGHYGPLPHKLRGKVDGICRIGVQEQQNQVANATSNWLAGLDQIWNRFH